MKILGRVLHAIDTMSLWTGKVPSFLIYALIGVIVYSVIMRYAFHNPLNWAIELSCFVCGTFWIMAGAYALVTKAHIRVDILYVRLSLRGKAIMDVITFPLFILFITILVWKGIDFFLWSLSHQEHSASMWGPPIYPLKIIIPVAAFLVGLQGLADFIRNLITAITGKRPTV